MTCDQQSACRLVFVTAALSTGWWILLELNLPLHMFLHYWLCFMRPHVYTMHSTVFWSILWTGVILMHEKFASTRAHLEQGACDVAYNLYLSTNAAEVWQFIAWNESPIIGDVNCSWPRVMLFASCMLLVTLCPSYVSANKPYSQQQVLECACSQVHIGQFPWEDRASLVLVVGYFWIQRYWCFSKAR